jgi:hypothetical protein
MGRDGVLRVYKICQLFEKRTAEMKKKDRKLPIWNYHRKIVVLAYNSLFTALA